MFQHCEGVNINEKELAQTCIGICSAFHNIQDEGGTNKYKSTHKMQSCYANLTNNKCLKLKFNLNKTWAEE